MSVETSSMLLWNPSAEQISQSNLTRFTKFLISRGIDLDASYRSLWEWSTHAQDEFWSQLLDFAPLIYTGGYTQVKSQKEMPGVKWFEGVKLNFAENMLAPFAGDLSRVAIRSTSESGAQSVINGSELLDQVTSFAQMLKREGIQKGDRVGAVCSNTIEPIVAMLACASIGAIWASCAPEFGAEAILDRFLQVEPKILIAVDGYRYQGKTYSCVEKICDVSKRLKSLKKVVLIHQISMQGDASVLESDSWASWVSASDASKLEFEALNFNDPLYILFSSGTTGQPKCIVHSVGGVLLQHYKELSLHTNLKAGERFFYYTTTGWMMWNWMVSSLMLGVELCVFDGSPMYPEEDSLWQYVAGEKIKVFGTSAKYISECRNRNLNLGKLNLSHLATVLSTGSPLLSEDFQWFYGATRAPVQLSSISGGTDIVSCFFLGNPNLPVRAGRLQCIGLGMDVKAYDSQGTALLGERGELVCESPTPSMPVCFWNDANHAKYKKAYFESYPGRWHHGDYIKILDTGEIEVFGRSDATLNPGGVRIGTSEVYRVVEALPKVEDSLVIHLEKEHQSQIILFVKLQADQNFDETLSAEIKKQLKAKASPRHVPQKIVQVADIPYTASGKKVELAVGRIFKGLEVDNASALKNPECLEEYHHLARQLI